MTYQRLRHVLLVFLPEYQFTILEKVFCNKKFTRFLDFFYQTFLGLELGTLFPARESLVRDIPAGDGNIAQLNLQCPFSDDKKRGGGWSQKQQQQE